MNTQHIEDFYYTCAETLCLLYASFPMRSLLLVEDIAGPIHWDMTGLPDRRSRACFETLIWLADHGLLSFRSVEPRDIGVEGAVLTQHAFVLLTGAVRWEDGDSLSRIDAILDARRRLAYDDIGTVVSDLFRANCLWSAPAPTPTLSRSPTLDVSEES